MVFRALRPRGVSMYPTIPTSIIGGVSTIVTASTISCLWDSVEVRGKGYFIRCLLQKCTYLSQACSPHGLCESFQLYIPCRQSGDMVLMGHPWGKSSPCHGVSCCAYVARILKNRGAEQRTSCETENKTPKQSNGSRNKLKSDLQWGITKIQLTIIIH